MYNIAIIQFPGSNCEYETKQAVVSQGLNARIVKWNEPLEVLQSFDGYILPGGFSYQDRVRAGAIAAKLPLLQGLIEADNQGKPILGICNGCQILAETGLIPNTQGQNKIEIALAHNKMSGTSNNPNLPVQNGEKIGFICDWKYVKVKRGKQTLFTALFEEDEILPIPINHGEGQFIVDASIANEIESHTQLLYCDANGNVIPTYPVNPNGSYKNLAGLSNKKGNVLAMMPHPERAYMVKQIPTWIDSPWTQKKKDFFRNNGEAQGPWDRFFKAIKHYIATQKAAQHA